MATSSTSDTGATGASGSSRTAASSDKLVDQIRLFSPLGHSGSAVLQVKDGDVWVDVRTVTSLD